MSKKRNRNQASRPASRRQATKPSPRPAGNGALSRNEKSKPQSSAAEARPAKRQARQQHQEPARRRRALRRRVTIAAIVAALLAAGGGWFYQSQQAAAELQAVLTAGSGSYDQESDPGRQHVANPSYEVNPPAGGPHLPAPAPPGIYTGSQVPPTGSLVHSFEHGAVILWYKPGLDPAELDTLRSLADEFPDDVLVVERESLPRAVAVTAWHQRLLLDSAEQEPLTRFITEFRNQGPENVG